MEQVSFEIKLALEQMAVKDATATLFAFFLMWAEKQGWWTREQIVETVRAAQDRPTSFPPPLSEELIKIYNEEWRSFFASLERRVAATTEPEDPKDPRDLWRVIPGGKS